MKLFETVDVQESPVRFLFGIFGQRLIIPIRSSISVEIHNSQRTLKIQAMEISLENSTQITKICPIHFRSFTRTIKSDGSEKMAKCPKYARKFLIFLDANLL